ncbi:MAG: hypothetical protein KZQ65_10295, partial [Candidatus Thiodiazotropha sp. (ex Gloverina cf. vestifex)]|nr:hypothetical protein [Candidatus Thiodiazotropha sp. (ex Gloverina cf. vestifex)]
TVTITAIQPRLRLSGTNRLGFQPSMAISECSHFFSQAGIAFFFSRIHDLVIHVFDLMRINSSFILNDAISILGCLWSFSYTGGSEAQFSIHGSRHCCWLMSLGFRCVPLGERGVAGSVLLPVCFSIGGGLLIDQAV